METRAHVFVLGNLWKFAAKNEVPPPNLGFSYEMANRQMSVLAYDISHHPEKKDLPRLSEILLEASYLPDDPSEVKVLVTKLSDIDKTIAVLATTAVLYGFSAAELHEAQSLALR